jgi:hypothetical protein
MKISFDLDDTAWKYRRFFSALALALKSQGHLVGILTGHGDHLREADLQLWVSRGFPPADFLYNADDIQRAGIQWHGAEQRGAKLALASLMAIDAHVDDFAYRHGGELELVLLGQEDESRA